MKNILNFIFAKKDEGIYRTYRIFGIKIITKPIILKMQNEFNYIHNNINDRTNIIMKNYYSKIIDEAIEYQKNKYKFNIDDYNTILYSIPIEAIKETICIFSILKNRLLYFNIHHKKLDACLIFGFLPFMNNTITMEKAMRRNIPLIVSEDGFISAASTWANSRLDLKYIRKISFTFSNLPHFFADEISTLEYMLNNEKLKLDNKQIERAKYLIDKIIKNKISKYNHQPIYKPEIGKNKNKVLVIDQSYGDMSISYGWANEDTFKNMLEVAIKENYNADIIIKTHPDALVKNSERAKCYYSSEDIKKNVYLMAEEINPISLLEIVDKVYVCTSQLGFEALMMGKEVHVFGMPFYAGYGLTIDYQKCERRKNNRTLEEIFYITYINYSYYVNPEKEERCEIEEAIDYLIKLRREYFLEFNIRCDDKNIVDLSERDFSLNSGERQTAQTLAEIRKDYSNILGYEAIYKLLNNYNFKTVLDIGSGEGLHSEIFKEYGKIVTSLDYGKSPYVLDSNNKQDIIIADFMKYDFKDKKFDAIWCCHILEHSLNSNLFLEKINSILEADGVLAITVPPLKNEIVGGHLSIWNAGLLLYQLVIAGFDCKDAIVKKYGYNISIIVKKNEIDIKNKLVYDNGDISTIRPYLPKQIKYDINFKDISFCGDIENIGW